MSAIPAMDLVLYPAAGGALGLVYFYLLYRSARLLVAQAPASRTLPLHLFRGAAAVSMFWMIAQQGAGPLVLALLGFVVARLLAQRALGLP